MTKTVLASDAYSRPRDMDNDNHCEFNVSPKNATKRLTLSQIEQYQLNFIQGSNVRVQNSKETIHGLFFMASTFYRSNPQAPPI